MLQVINCTNAMYSNHKEQSSNKMLYAENVKYLLFKN